MNRLGELLSDHVMSIRVMERRWHPRYMIDLAASISIESNPLPYPCRVRNYSMGDLFIETQAPLYRHQIVLIAIPQGDGRIKTVRGMVINLTDGGAGIEAERRFWARDCDFCPEARPPRYS